MCFGNSVVAYIILVTGISLFQLGNCDVPVPLAVKSLSQKLIVPLSHGSHPGEIAGNDNIRNTNYQQNHGVNRYGIAEEGNIHFASIANRQYGPSPTYESVEKQPDFLQLLLPALAITGLSLLFPNVITITGRKKRDLSNGESIFFYFV